MALTDNLTAYYKLDETSGTREDSTASNYDLTDNNTVGYATGIIGNGADFVASNSESLSTSSNELNDTFSSSAWSVSIWAKPDDISNTYGLIACDTNTGQRQFFFAINSASLYFERQGASIAINVGNVISTGWNHIVATYDNSRLRIYVNGTNVGDNPLMSAFSSSTNKTFLGCRQYSGSNYYINGILDEVGIWAKTLTSTEITTLYNSGSGLTYPFSSGPANLKSWNGLAKASIKSINGLAIASIKNIDGLS